MMYIALTPLPKEAASELVTEFLSVMHLDGLSGCHKLTLDNTPHHTAHCTSELLYHCASQLGKDWSSRHRYTSRMPRNREIMCGGGNFSISICC